MTRMFLLSLFWFALAPLAPLLAQEPGAALFQTYCATCHGSDARGDGPTAELMAIQPPDLTALARRHDGTFPTLLIARQIDGRDLIPSHGGPMPIFGTFFEGKDVALKLPSGQPIMVSQPLADLLAWLEQIQE